MRDACELVPRRRSFAVAADSARNIWQVLVVKRVGRSNSQISITKQESATNASTCPQGWRLSPLGNPFGDTFSPGAVRDEMALHTAWALRHASDGTLGIECGAGWRPLL